MDKKLITGLSVFGIIVLAYIINITMQKGYNSQEDKLTVINKDEINKIVISSNQDAIELMQVDTTWVISGNDTLVIKENSIDNFFDKIFDLNKQHLVTSKEENWPNYSLDAESGTHLAFINSKGETIAYYVFGRSQSEYNICYVRANKSTDVYLLDTNIMYQLQTRPTFWGTKPEPEKLEEEVTAP